MREVVEGDREDVEVAHVAAGTIGLADALGLPLAGVRAGLRTFGSVPEDNSGRGSVFDMGGIRIIVDFAHNPHGIAAMAEMALGMDAGQVGGWADRGKGRARGEAGMQ